MSKDKLYSINELNQIEGDINRAIDKETSEDSKFKRNLIFSLRKNAKKIRDNREVASEDLKESSEEYVEFEDRKLRLIKKYGGNIEIKNDQWRISNARQVFSDREFTKELKELSEEYEEAIKEEDKKVRENEKIRNEKMASVDWVKIPLSDFPEEISGENLPLSFLEFVYKEEEN